jgi:AhpD family alkylhydroperoxidase
MQARLSAADLGNEGYKALLALESYMRRSSLEKPLYELVKLRASQINGCAYCLDMHSKDARAAGEQEQRIYCLNAWRECPFYTDRERAALEWTEAVTLITQGHVPDEVYERVRQHFSEKELVDLNFAVIAINAWNRLAIPFRAVPGSYKPGAHTAL